MHMYTYYPRDKYFFNYLITNKLNLLKKIKKYIDKSEIEK